MAEQLFDIIAVEIAPPHRERVMDTAKTKESADSYIKIAIARRGVDDEFYKAVPHDPTRKS